MILLNPGPVTLSERVRRALAKPDLCHREPEFYDLQDSVRRQLLAAYALDPATFAAVLLTGSGTAAVEAMIASLVPAAGRLLVIENGVYGQRMTAMARAHGIDHSTLPLDWGAAIEPDDVARALAADPRFTHVALVHHETTTGRLNDLATIAQRCRERGAALLVDAVSSFGAESLDFEGIGAVAATANKCLHGVPGIAFVVARRAALAAAAPARTLYLDLPTYARAQDARGTPFTPAIHVLYALDEALSEFAEGGGWRARRARYRALGAQVERGFTGLGLVPLLPAAESSVVLRAWRLPAGIGYAALHDHLKARGFVIYAGQGKLAEGIFRVSPMGAIETADIDRLIAATAEVVRRP